MNRNNISAGRLRHQVTFYMKNELTDEWGEQQGDILIKSARADVQVTSGGESAQYGTVLTSQVITIMLYYDYAITNDMVVAWDGAKYDIKHIRPDETKRSMIVTAEVQANAVD